MIRRWFAKRKTHGFKFVDGIIVEVIELVIRWKSKIFVQTRWMHIKVAHFLSLYGFSTNCILFKCHIHIIKSSIWQKYLWIKIANLNKNIYWGVNSINIHQSYSNGLLKWAYGLWSRLCISIQMHFLLWFHLNIFYKDSLYDTWWKKNMDWKKLQQKI
jgi:hypothetical protein